MNPIKQWCIAAAWMAALLVPLAPLTARATDPDPSAQIRATVASLASQWSAHDAHRLAQTYFTQDVSLLGEGGKQLTRGQEQLQAVLRELFSVAPQVRLEVRHVKVLATGVAYAWVVWHCNPDQAEPAQFKVRSLYVWKREAGQWKIAADAYSMGDIPR